MNPSALEDLWTAVRLAAEGSDWKRDQGETLTAWAQRTLRAQRAEELPQDMSVDRLVGRIHICVNELAKRGGGPSKP